ncbi:uncharacterized protein At4g26450 isoform X1 [Lactuca sativa]|uniref:Uncharacterized protein n=1 Tax=Lactuca sativa TaxID=4236 RepID=A0A9R1X238_LACSA|nr:uncharacterized protein At4g26450 isoform X1 [Lactuca sativa]KAJ0195534.1 hypothetical protein LSAT_V11C700387080 [Lactuca sativa]
MQRHRNPANGYRSNPIGIGGSAGGVAAGGPGYRNYNRSGFGRGQPPPPRRIDIFLEAGKLATEYLVSKGLLPPNSLNAKWQNSNLKNQIGGADGVSDAVSGTTTSRRRLSDDYSGATGSRDGIRARKTTGSFKNPAFEYNHEINRSSSWSEKVKGSSDKQGEGDSFSGSMEEQRSGKDGTSEDQKSVSGDLESKNHNTANIETTIENQQNQSPDDNPSIKTPNSDQVNVDDSKNPNMSTEEVITDDSNQDSEKPIVKEENNNNTANNNNSSTSDLLTLIRFNKVPTRTRSSIKGSKSDPVDKTQNSGEPENKNQELNDEMKIEEDEKYKFGHGVCTRSQSFPQRSSISEQESSEEHHGYARCSSDLLGRGEKRSLQINDNTEGSKKLKDWVSPNTQTDDYAEEKQLFPSSLSSFKICDLNLMGGSEVNENNHDTNKVIAFPAISQTKQEPVTVDFDLSMTNTRRGADGKEVEIIDLDCDSVQDDKDFNNSERREEAIFTDLESFPDSMQRVSDMPQDGYGLMISELLEADIPNSSVSSGVNSMHNEISLQNEEGILGDDESIYMSLGEIPISFVPVWDQQPSQGYDKRY